MLNKAIIVAVNAHQGQVDKAGSPYILHPLRVMLSLENETERICGVLHDVVEDSDITLDDLRSMGFSDDVLTVLDYLTKKDGESYDEFIGRVLTNEMACRVKLADINDNMDLSRIKDPTYEDYARVEKYKIAAKRITSIIAPSN